jgi:pimeloyl-ACP methyl ester carboxylesterase
MASEHQRSAEAEIAPRLPMPADLIGYQIDAWQRGVLFLDVMRRRAEQADAQAAQAVPHVLQYEAELVCDGRTLPRPVNYLLVRIVPSPDEEIDPRKRPFVVVDPRAGHGPGIGGFKADSEIGVAMKAGHPCYFVGFLPQPAPDQTIEDIAHAEARFLEIVIERHPEADGKPCVIGNCQAGWAMMMVDALRPELFGPIIIAGSPLSYWAGVKGQYPMRYSGGLLGGSWLTALTSDMGAGVFDGAWLVQNFENQNPANTLWSKHYNLYSKVDTEAERYLGFEKWWGGHIDLNAEEIQWIVDELFVGNKLAAGEIRTSDGTTVDLRNIRAPIVVFCSKGDNITPPQQALDWILDLYDSVDEIRANGQTIVYTIHDTIGHLGIFVSAGVAKKEHDEFASNIDFIDLLPPGLYEAILEPKGDAVDRPDLVTGQWVMRCEHRSLDDIRALGGNDLEDERRFAAAARMSEINLALYRTFAQPLVRSMVTPPVAEALRQMHPLRLQYEMLGPDSPFRGMVESLARQVRGQRSPVASDNPFLAVQEMVSRQIVLGFEAWRKATEKLSEQTFLSIYGAKGLQAALGIDTATERRPRKAAKHLLHDALVERRITELKEAMTRGGLREAMLRSAVYVGLARTGPDERSFEAMRRIREQHRSLPLAEFKAVLREQYFMLLVDEEAAVEAIPGLLPENREERAQALEILSNVLTAAGPLSEVAAQRMKRVEEIFEITTSAGKSLGVGAEVKAPFMSSTGRSAGPGRGDEPTPRAKSPVPVGSGK